MTYLTVNTEADAISVLSGTTEREAIHAAIYMTLPPNGDVITNAELAAAVHHIVDPIHSHLLSPSDSYTEVSPTGRRTRSAITASCQTMSERNGNGGDGWGLIKRDRGKRSYLPNGEEKALEIFASPKYRPIVEALALMLELRETPIDAEVVPIDTCQELIDSNQEVIDQVAAAQSADKPEPVEPAADQVDHRSWIDQLNDRADELESRLDKIEAYDRTLALVKEWLADREAKNPTGVMADTLRLILAELERRE